MSETIIKAPDQYLMLEFDVYYRYGEQYKPPRKMKAQWTPELAQDLEAYHSIDIEAELAALISKEIDRTIINQILNERRK